VTLAERFAFCLQLHASVCCVFRVLWCCGRWASFFDNIARFIRYIDWLARESFQMFFVKLIDFLTGRIATTAFTKLFAKVFLAVNFFNATSTV